MKAYREMVECLRLLAVAVLIVAYSSSLIIWLNQKGTSSTVEPVVIAVLVVVLGLVLCMINLTIKQIMDLRSAAVREKERNGVRAVEFYTERGDYLVPKPSVAPGANPILADIQSTSTEHRICDE
ncbi:hypothetical protein SK128_018459, partial [Halocaridina rubra]